MEWKHFLVLIVVIIVKGDNVDLDENAKTLHKLFSDFEKRDTPLLQCGGFYDGVKYRMSKIPECPTYPNVKEEAVALTVTTFWTSPGDKPISAKECFSKVETTYRYKFLFGYVDEYVKEETPKFISESMCNEMVKSERTPDGRKMTRIRDGLYGTTDVKLPEPIVWRQTEETNVNYFWSVMDITVDEDNEQIRTGALIEDSCLASAGFCPTMNGVLVWKSNQVPKCRLREGPTSDCIKVKDTITCPEIEFLFSNVTSVKICEGLNIATNDQQVYLASKYPGEILPDTVAVTEVRKQLQNDNSRVKRHRGYVRPPAITPAPIRLFSDKEMNSKLSYVYQAVKQGHDFDIQNILNQVCHVQQQQHQLVHFMAEIGHPTAIARMITGDSAYRAKLAGDVLSLWKCEEIYEYYFLPRENCTEEWPVRVVSKHDKHTAWVTPLSHELVSQPTIVECPPTPFYFQMKEHVILLSNKTVVSNLPILPSLGDDKGTYGLPDLTFKSQGHYLAQELSGTITLQKQVSQMSQGRWIDRALQKSRQGVTLNSQEQSAISDLRALTLGPLMDTIWFLVISVVVIAVIMCAALILIYRQQIHDVIKPVWNLFVNLFIGVRNLFTAPGKQNRDAAEQKALQQELQRMRAVMPPAVVINMPGEVNVPVPQPANPIPTARPQLPVLEPMYEVIPLVPTALKYPLDQLDQLRE